MKPIIPFALLGALFAVGAADAATTDPVGYTTNLIKAAFSPSSAKTNFVSLPLVNPASWAGTVTSVSGDVLTLNVGAAPLTAGSFDKFGPLAFPGTTVYRFYIETDDGYYAQIESNGTGAVTVESTAGSNFSATEAVTIRRHRTIADLFGPNNEAGLQVTLIGDPNEADNINIIDETNGGNVGIFPSPGVIPGATFVDTAFNDADDYPIYPDQGLQVVRRAASDLPLTVTGEVHTIPTQIQVTSGFQIRPVVLPVDVALSGLNLYTGDIATGLAGTDEADLNEADKLSIVVNGNSTGYFYSTIDLDPAPGDQLGWYDDSFNYVHNTVLPAGAALNITRNNPTNSAPFVWINPAPTITP